MIVYRGPQTTEGRTDVFKCYSVLFLFFLIFSFCAVRWFKLAILPAFERTLVYRVVS